MSDNSPNISSGGSLHTGLGESAPVRRLTQTEFGKLLSESRKPLWSIAAAVLSDRSTADDCIQDASAIALGKLGEFDASTNFAAWMGQIVRFVALNELRKRTRSRSKASDPEILAASFAAWPEPDPEPIDRMGRFSSNQSAFDDRTQAALRAIDETARICLLLRTVHSMPYDEISRILGIPPGTAMSHVHRARATMREKLSDRSDSRGGSPHGRPSEGGDR